LAGNTWNQPGKFFIHVQYRKPQEPNMFRQIHFNFLTAGNQGDVMIRQCPGKLQAAYEMTHSPNVLAVKNDFHMTGLMSVVCRPLFVVCCKKKIGKSLNFIFLSDQTGRFSGRRQG
jgi:hypothetical protein